MSGVLRWLFFAAVVRPVLLVVLGIHVRDRDRLPAAGPAIVVANHNSHLDTLTLMSLFPLRLLPRLRPVAAMDYFLATPLRAWFARRIVGIVPVARGGRAPGTNPLAEAEAALDAGAILILFPEGTRGEPERRAALRKGVAHLVRARPAAPVVPVFLHGLGKALPRGTWLLVPFTCDVFVGRPLAHDGTVEGIMAALEAAMAGLAAEGAFPPWD